MTHRHHNRRGTITSATNNGGCNGASVTHPATAAAASLCPLCRSRPTGATLVNACDPARRFNVCGPCFDEAMRSGGSWWLWAYRAGLANREDVPDLATDDDDDTDGAEVSDRG